MVDYWNPSELSEALKNKDNKIQIIDVRDDDFNEIGNIPGCLNYPSNSWIDNDNEIENILYKLNSNNNNIAIFHCMYSQVRGKN